MIPQNTALKRQSTIEGEEIMLQIDAEATPRIMGYLIKLYSDSEMACIREAATNARDSHIEAGQTKPIEVITPSKLSPVLIIKDFGVGLDRKDFADVYTRYGVSTKRESNDFNGHLGLGCKSPLAYADQFTVIGIKDGVCTTASVARHENGSATLTIIDELPTDEPNGVTVQIPATPENHFQEKAEKLFRFWEEGTVLLNGKVPERVTGSKVSDRLLLAKGLDNHYVVMGNVPYPFYPSWGLGGDFHVVAYVDMGEITHTPSREALELNDPTKETIENLKEELTEGLTKAIQKEINEQPSPETALKSMVRWRETVEARFLGEVKYRGTTLPTKIERVTVVPAEGEVPAKRIPNSILVTTEANASEGAHSLFQSIGAANAPLHLYVEGWTFVKFNINHKRKLRKYVDKLREENKFDLDIKNFVLTKERFVEVEPWVDKRRFIHWDDVKQVRLERAPRGTSAPKANVYYEGFRPGSNYREDISLKEILEGKQVFYYERPKDTYWRAKATPLYRDDRATLMSFFPDAYLIEFAATRTKRFTREVPKAISVKEACGKIAAKAKDVRIDDLRAIALRTKYYWIDKLDPNEIKDPAVRKAIKLSQRSVPGITAGLGDAKGLLTRFGYTVKLSVDDIPVDVFEPYSLLYKNSRLNLEHPHFYTYVNAVYQQNRKEKKNGTI